MLVLVWNIKGIQGGYLDGVGVSLHRGSCRVCELLLGEEWTKAAGSPFGSTEGTSSIALSGSSSLSPSRDAMSSKASASDLAASASDALCCTSCAGEVVKRSGNTRLASNSDSKIFRSRRFFKVRRTCFSPRLWRRDRLDVHCCDTTFLIALFCRI